MVESLKQGIIFAYVYTNSSGSSVFLGSVSDVENSRGEIAIVFDDAYSFGADNDYSSMSRGIRVTVKNGTNIGYTEKERFSFIQTLPELSADIIKKSDITKYLEENYPQFFI